MRSLWGIGTEHPAEIKTKFLPMENTNFFQFPLHSLLKKYEITTEFNDGLK